MKIEQENERFIAACFVLAGMMARDGEYNYAESTFETAASDAVSFADALLKELRRPIKQTNTICSPL